MDKLTKAVLGVVLLGLVGLLVLWNSSRSDDSTTAVGTVTTTTVGGAAPDEDEDATEDGASETEATTEVERSTTTAASPSSTTTTPASSTTTTDAAGAGAGAGLSLPEADESAPPVEPLGVYSDGKVTLTGSVPNEELATAYRDKVAGVIGADNVTVQMTVDPRVSGETLTVDVAEQFRFPSGSSEFDPQFEALLNLGIAALQLLPESTLVVTGHTDDVGSDEVNEALSIARAQIVVDFMVRGGIPAERVVARGAGETQPIADNATAEGRQANRRIEATLEGIRPG